MTNNIINLVYTYAKRRLKNPLEIFYQIAHTSQIIAWIPSRLFWTPEFRVRDRSLLRPIFPKALTVTNNQEGPTIVGTSTRCIIWDSGCTRSINPSFWLYTENKPLVKEDDTEVNGIGGIIKPKGIFTVVLDLEDNTGQIHNLTFKQVCYFPGEPKILISP